MREKRGKGGGATIRKMNEEEGKLRKKEEGKQSEGVESRNEEEEK